MRIQRIVKMFDQGNVCVFGLRGCGKDMLTSNVVVRRRLPYVSNVDYGGQYNKFYAGNFDCGENTYRQFLNDDVNYYKYPFPDGTDLYLSDAGVYFPAQFCNELNRDYKFFPTFFALSRHVGDANVHFNVQALNRAWDKIREQADQYICCRWCKVFFGKIVLQKVRIYELYESAVKKVPPFRLPKPLLSPARIDQWRMEKERYEQSYGVVDERILLYIHKSNYDTRIFKKILEGGKR